MAFDRHGDGAWEKKTAGGLAVGDRVRLSTRCKSPRHRAGETGRIVWVSRWGLYHVRLDRPGGPPLASFEPAEVERAEDR